MISVIRNTLLHGQMTEKIASEAINKAKNIKKKLNAFFYHFKNHETKSKTIFGKFFPHSFLILHGQMTEKIAFEVRPKKGPKIGLE